ncbi:MAG: carboxypeptidase-like regulatory domain-containing protein [Terriglobia bacterium]
MMRRLTVTSLIGFLILGTASLALCADIVGTVADANATPVQGVQIQVKNSSGKIFGAAVTDKTGHYHIAKLNPGQYEYALNTLNTGFKAGTAVSYLPSNGLTLNWKLSKANVAIALAHPGTQTVVAGDPFGFTPGGFAALIGVTAFALGAEVTGAYAAAGEFSGSAASPSL